LIFVGIDPGQSGAIAAVNEDGSYYGHVKLSETEHDVAQWIFMNLRSCATFAMLERVHAMPRQGVSSTFKFGTSYGFCRGLLAAHRLPFEEVTPTGWQTAMKCRTKGDKNVTKAAAQRLFPTVRITHAIADALLLAEHSRRAWAARSTDSERGDQVD